MVISRLKFHLASTGRCDKVIWKVILKIDLHTAIAAGRAVANGGSGGDCGGDPSANRNLLCAWLPVEPSPFHHNSSISTELKILTRFKSE